MTDKGGPEDSQLTHADRAAKLGVSQSDLARFDRLAKLDVPVTPPTVYGVGGVEKKEEFKVGMAEKQEGTRSKLAFGLTIATVLFGVGYVCAPLWAPDLAWQQARDAFQVVFTAMVGLTGSAIGFYFSERRHQQEAAKAEEA